MKIVDCVVGEGLGHEDARVVDDVVDRTEFGDCGLGDVLSRRCLTDVSVNERKVWRQCETSFGDTARSRNDVIVAIQKGVDNGCPDSLRGAGYYNRLIACHIHPLPFLAET